MSKNLAAVELSRLGASKGGHARAAKLTPAQRSASARRASRARWGIPEQPPTFAETLEWARSELNETRRMGHLLRRKEIALMKMIAGLEFILQDDQRRETEQDPAAHAGHDTCPSCGRCRDCGGQHHITCPHR